MPAAVHVWFAQQGWLSPPHVKHVFVSRVQPSVASPHA
jgi:hypothetical protein